jgi:bifunctional enzyme CysN/CysC
MRLDSPQNFVAAGDAQPSSSYGSAVATIRPSAPELNGIIRLLTCGSVDDGKSTLIGRLLWDASPLYDDQRERLLKETASLNGARRPDFSRLVDGLIAEQEQGITIDIAWHFFDTASRRFVIIDTPGHEQYTRNMATGASHADVAVLLVDAQSGIKRQTRRHLAILDLVGVRNVILAVNKMDLVDWSEERFNSITADFEKLVARFPSLTWTSIPVSALTGDNVAARSQVMDWYSGSTLVDYLERVPMREDNVNAPFRMTVQMVLRDGEGFRGLAGTIGAGEVRPGDQVLDVISGGVSRVSKIRTLDGDLVSARCGQAVVIQLAGDFDIGRGSILTGETNPAQASRSLKVRLAWLANQGYAPSQGYLLRTAADLVPVVALKVSELLDLDTLDLHEAGGCEPNDIALAQIDLSRPVAVGLFSEQPDTGAFLLVDAVTGAAVAGGVITEILAQEAIQESEAFVLTREMLERGLCADLQGAPEAETELKRRANEAAIILRAAGVPVEIGL